jgi:predicted MFS family arabinose efflux permease
MFQALRVRDFALLWTAQLTSGLGSWLLAIAAPAQVLISTNSVLGTGLVVAAEYLPFLLLGPVAGALVDRLDRRLLLVAADLARAAAVALLFLADQIPWAVHLAVFAGSAVTVVAKPAMQAQVPAVVGTARLLGSANALIAASDGTTRLLGGPLGGALLAVIGFRALVAADLVSYLLSAALVASTRSRRTARDRTAGPASTPFRDVVPVLRAHPVVAALLPATATFLMANAALSSLLIALGTRNLGSAAALGPVLSALGLGFLVGAPLLGVLVDRVPIRPLLAAAQATAAIGFALLVDTTELGIAVLAAVVIGASGAVVLGAPRITWQRTVPAATLGRIAAAFGITDAASALTGAVLGPTLAQLAGLHVAAVAAVATALAASALTLLLVDRPRTRPG